MQRVIWTSLAACLLVAVGCQEDLPKATLIDHMRVLGARSEVQGDPSRTDPRLGETAELTWAMAYPSYDETDDALASLFLVCTAPSRFTGIPVCQEIVDIATGKTTPVGFGLGGPSSYSCDGKLGMTQEVAGLQVACVAGTPKVSVKVAQNAEGASRLVQGIICRNGIPELDLASPTGVGCRRRAGVKKSEVESIPVYGTVKIARDEKAENKNVDLSSLRVSLRASESAGDRVWPKTPEELLPELIEDCSAAPASAVESSNGHAEVLDLRFKNDDAGDDDVQFSVYATYGDLSRRFTIISAGSDQPDADYPDLVWDLSEEQRDDLLGTSKLVRFYFTAMDGRGGFDLTTRELCVSRLVGDASM